MGQPAQKKPKTERTLLFDPWYLTEGNPDKLCDEAAYEELSFESKVACETAAKDNKALSQEKERERKRKKEKEREKEKEKEREKELRQEAERDAHIANYRADLDDWMQLLMM